jgi:UDPglucose 6-dehydrogenase
MNDFQETRFVRRVIKNMFNTVAGKKIALFGFAFKANTGDTREAPAIYISRMLLDEHASLSIYDPEALENAKKDLADQEGTIEYVNDPYECAKDAHAILIITEWDEFKKYDYSKILNSMQKPAFIFDGRNILNHKELFELGFNVSPLGSPDMVNL